MLYLCCTKLSFTTVNPLFIGYSVAIYDKPMLAAAHLSVLLILSNLLRHIYSLWKFPNVKLK